MIDLFFTLKLTSAPQTASAGISCHFISILTFAGIKVTIQNIHTFTKSTDTTVFTFINVCNGEVQQ